jgi:hypothetical protein
MRRDAFYAGAASSLLPSPAAGPAALTPQAERLIQNMIAGGLSPSQSVRDAAYFGVLGGVPGSGLATRYGVDLYGRRRAALQQQGLQDLLAMMGQKRADAALSLQAAQAADEFDLQNRRLADLRRPRQSDGIVFRGMRPLPI